MTCYQWGDHARARRLYEQALAILEKRPGVAPLHLATSLNGLGALLVLEDDFARAEALNRRALAIREKVLGPGHLLVAQSLGNLSWTFRLKGDAQQAVAFLAQCHEITERNLIRNLAAGSERQKLAYLDMFARQTDRIISLHAQAAPDNPQAIQLAVTALLRRKGRALDAMTDSLTRLRRQATAQDRLLLDDLAAVRSELALAAFSAPRSPNAQSRVRQLEERVEKIEAELSARSPAFQAQSRPATLANIQSAIPAGAALIEFATYLPYNPQTRGFGFPRFVAYVVPSSGAPRWAALGTAARTDEAVDRLRRALRSSNRTDVKRFARKLDKLTMRPIRALLGDARRVFISPYGSLNLIPFVALVDERGRYLVERYSFSYLSSGRDLLRLQAAGPSRSAPLIVAAPAFGPASGKAAAGGELQASADQTAKPSPELSRIVFKPLPGAADEAQSLKRLLPGAQILMGEQATETALKQVNAPSILHIATHGFFLKDAEALADNTRGLGLSESAAAMASAADDPLLRSGLALAGANEHRGDRDDGILTALEVAGLDLWGTKLVALSACNTGVGEVRSSEGVYGLRRAQALAGSESQLMSLWPVSDRGTRDLMIAYYHALTRGQGRGDAPRQVQLRMLRGKDRRHPYYWASFIQSGEWKSLDGKEPNLRRR